MMRRWGLWVGLVAVAGGAVFWGLQLSFEQPVAAPQPVVAVVPTTSPTDLTRLLDSDPRSTQAAQVATEPPPEARLQLLGVVSPVAGARNGVALIAVDRQAPRVYAVGDTVYGKLELQSVHQRGASLGLHGQPASVNLELAPLAPPVSGSAPDFGGTPARSIYSPAATGATRVPGTYSAGPTPPTFPPRPAYDPRRPAESVSGSSTTRLPGQQLPSGQTVVAQPSASNSTAGSSR